MDSFLTDKRRFSRQDVAALLAGSNALAELDLAAAYAIVGYMEARRIKATAVVVQEGFTNTGFMALVLQGDAVVENEQAKRTDSLVITQLGVGALVGELGLIDGQPRSATVRAVTDLDLAVLERAALTRLIQEQPEIACRLLASILASVSLRLRATNRKLLSIHRVNRSMQGEIESHVSAFQSIQSA